MSTQLHPVIRDVVFLIVGSGIFVWESLNEGRLAPLAFASLMALGPSFVAAYWSARIRVNGSLRQPDASSPSPFSSPSSPGGEP